MSELTSEQVARIIGQLRPFYAWHHELDYVLETDAALRARVAELELETERLRIEKPYTETEVHHAIETHTPLNQETQL